MPPEPAQQADFERATNAARQALRTLDFARGRQYLAQAQAAARLPEQRAQVADLQLLAAYAAGFADAVHRAATTLPAATEVEVGTDMVVSIVETGPKHIVVRVAGRNRRYAVEQLPVGLAAALGDHALGREPDALARKAAYLLLHPETDEPGSAKALEWLRGAAQSLPEAARILAAVGNAD